MKLTKLLQLHTEPRANDIFGEWTRLHDDFGSHIDFDNNYINALGTILHPTPDLETLSTINDQVPLDDPFLDSGESSIRMRWEPAHQAARELYETWKETTKFYEGRFRTSSRNNVHPIRNIIAQGLQAYQLALMTATIPLFIAGPFISLPGILIGTTITATYTRDKDEKKELRNNVQGLTSAMWSHSLVTMRVARSLGVLGRLVRDGGNDVEERLARQVYAQEAAMQKTASQLYEVLPELPEDTTFHERTRFRDWKVQREYDALRKARPACETLMNESFPYGRLWIDERQESHSTWRDLEQELLLSDCS